MTPSEIEDFASSDFIWGQGKEGFFNKAYRMLDDGKFTDVPDQWGDCLEAYRYNSFKVFFEEEK